MTSTSSPDEELDRLLQTIDPIDRQALERDDVTKASHQLLDAITQGKTGPGPASSTSRAGVQRGRWLTRPRVALFGAALLAAVVAGVVIAMLGSSGSPGGSNPRIARSAPVKVPVAPLTASVVLERAADVARRQLVAASSGQWVYLKTFTGLTSSGGARGATGRPYGVRFWQTSTDQWWLNNSGAQRHLMTDIRERFFGARDAAIATAHGKTLAQLDKIVPGRRSDEFFPAGSAEPGIRANGGFFGPALPTQPTALLRALKREEHKLFPAQSHARVTSYGLFNLITGRLLVDSSSPPLRAALFRVLARLPGIHLLGDRRDRLGRQGVAISVRYTPGDTGPAATIVLINPQTSSVLETEQVNLQQTPSGTPGALPFPAGTPTSYTVYRQRAVVNSDHQFPDARKSPQARAGGQ